mgnify:CR=1 FL=1
MVDRNINNHHQDKLVTLFGLGREYRIAVIPLGQIAPHLGDGPVLANLYKCLVIPYKRVKNVPVYAGIIIYICFLFLYFFAIV